MPNEKEIQAQATDWAVDYKPWDESLPYREYAKHGYAEGFKAARRELEQGDPEPAPEHNSITEFENNFMAAYFKLGDPEPEPRKIIQICKHGFIYALCNDGTVWSNNFTTTGWIKMSSIPQPPKVKK